MGSGRRRFAAAFTALAAVGLSIASIITAAPAFANAGNPLVGTTGTATVAPNGDITVTVSGTWQWGNLQGDLDKCSSRYGNGWAVAWGDPNQPGNPVKDKSGNVVLSVGTPTDNTVHFDPINPLGTCTENNGVTIATGPWSDTHTYKAGTPIGDICVNMYDLHDTPAAKPGDYIAGGPNNNSDNSVHTNDFDPNSNTAGYCFSPATLKIKKVDDAQPPKPLAGAKFGLYAGTDLSVAPVATCTSIADGTCDFSVINPGDYTIHEISAPAGYNIPSPPDNRPVTLAKGQHLDLSAQPFTDNIKKGWVRVVKVLQDSNHQPVTVADKHALDGASFILYSDKNNDGAFQAGEEAKLLPAETADATCTVSGGTGQCDIGPVRLGAYRVHETATPPATTAGPDIDVTVVETTAANPTTVNYVNFVGDLNISLVKSGPDLVELKDAQGNATTFTYTFQATTTGPRLHNITLQDPNPDEATPGRCTTAITPAFGAANTGDTNHDGYLDKGETWTWTCTHTITASDPNPLHNTAKVTGTDDFGRSVSNNASHDAIIIDPHISVTKAILDAKGNPVTATTQAHEGDKVTYSFTVTNTSTKYPTALTGVTLQDNVLGTIGATIPALAAGESKTFTQQFTVPTPSTTPIINTVTACGTDALNRQVCDQAHHELDPIHPAITVVKTASAAGQTGDVTSAHVGDTVTYSFKVTNSGDVALTNVSVNDDKLGPIGTVSSLGVGASTTLTKDFKVPDVASVDNTATACGTDPLALQVCDTDHHHLITIHPAITVVKSAASQAHEGDTVTYTFKVTNSGDVALTNVAVTDDKLGSIGTIGDLAVGASKTLTKDFKVPTPSTSTITNTATACGDDPLQKEVCNTDHHNLDPIHPKIAIVKDGPALAHVGDTITYTFTVTNPGDVALHNVVLTDPKCDTAPKLVSQTGGNTDAILDLTETWAYTCPHTITAGDPDPLPNTGTVTGVDPLDKTVTANSSHTVDIIHPAIQVQKSGPAEAHEGDTVTYTFKVTNTGDVALSNVTAVDDVLGNVGTVSSLDVGASTTLTKDFKIPSPSTSVDNTVTACGTDPLSKQVCDDDHHHLTPKHPAITVVKSGPATANANQTITYTFKVTNSGDIDLTNVQVTDDKLGSIGTVASLPIGASTTLTKDFTVPSGATAVDNTVTACGTDTLSLQVCATDHHHLDVTQVLGENVVRPSAPLAVTGADLGWRSLIGLLLLLGGVTLRVIRRRARRSGGLSA